MEVKAVYEEGSVTIFRGVLCRDEAVDVHGLVVSVASSRPIAFHGFCGDHRETNVTRDVAKFAFTE
jgi:hypothetical protein